MVGIGLILLSSENSLLAIRELRSKPEIHKKAGMLSFPLETFKEKDGNLRATIGRLLEEELGIPIEEVELWGIAPQFFTIIPGRRDIRVYYGVGTYLGDPTREFRPKDDDVEVVGWMTPGGLLMERHIRVEVAPILLDFSIKKKEDYS